MKACLYVCKDVCVCVMNRTGLSDPNQILRADPPGAGGFDGLLPAKNLAHRLY